jgi:hypothetical protein
MIFIVKQIFPEFRLIKNICHSIKIRKFSEKVLNIFYFCYFFVINN